MPASSGGSYSAFADIVGIERPFNLDSCMGMDCDWLGVNTTTYSTDPSGISSRLITRALWNPVEFQPTHGYFNHGSPAGDFGIGIYVRGRLAPQLTSPAIERIAYTAQTAATGSNIVQFADLIWETGWSSVPVGEVIIALALGSSSQSWRLRNFSGGIINAVGVRRLTGWGGSAYGSFTLPSAATLGAADSGSFTVAGVPIFGVTQRLF
jgi:hypothetical protein